MAWLPVMLRLDGLHCVVVGGGAVAERKVLALLAASGNGGGQSISVISPSVTAKLSELAGHGGIKWFAREYLEGDLAEAALAFAATNVSEVNERVAVEAKARGVWSNVADDPEIGSVLMPAVVRRGKLTLTVSTAGASPSVARRIRRELDERYGPEYEVWLDWLAEARLLLRGCVADMELRQELHRELDRLDGTKLLRSGLLPQSGWQHTWLEALEREPAAETVRRLASLL